MPTTTSSAKPLQQLHARRLAALAIDRDAVVIIQGFQRSGSTPADPVGLATQQECI